MADSGGIWEQEGVKHTRRRVGLKLKADNFHLRPVTCMIATMRPPSALRQGN